jgi:nicotinate-nucleotide adenylyltransferase
MRIGLFFGSFNPIHVGHLIIASTMADRAPVDQVWFVVSPQNPFKQRSALLHEFDRMHMVRLAIADNPQLNATDVEFHMPKPSYTADTLAYLSERHPNDTFRVIMGEDNLQHFHRWKNHAHIVETHGLLVYPRPNAAKTEWHGHPQVSLIEAPQVDISATFIREAVRQGHSIRYLVPQHVEEYIRAMRFFEQA